MISNRWNHFTRTMYTEQKTAFLQSTIMCWLQWVLSYPLCTPPFKSSSYSTVCICEEPEMMESWYRTGAPVYSSSHPHLLHAGKMWIFIMSQHRNLHVWYEVRTWSATDPESTLVPALTTASPHTTKRCFLPQFVTYLPLPSKPSSRIRDFTGKYVFKYQQHSIS